jgi:hypothetical protein
MGFIQPRPEPEQKGVRELLIESRELLKQMQAGWTGGFTVPGVHPAVLLRGARFSGCRK